MELIRAADILIEKIKQDYKDDIACVVIMGSYIYDEIHSRSDLDMYFVPKTPRGENLERVFIIDGIGFDFWAIPWDRLERIANYEERITAILTEGRVIYYGSEEDLDRFNQLKARALDTRDKGRFIQKAQAQFNECYKRYFQLLGAKGLSEARMHAMGIIFSLTYSIALLNRTSVKRGRGKLKKEIMDMELVPKDFADLYDTVFVTSDIDEIKLAYGTLIRNMADLLERERAKEKKPASFADSVDGYYEELINSYNKIYHACETGNIYTALFASVELTQEFAAAFQGTGVSINQLPDIVGAFDPSNLEDFMAKVQEHQVRLVHLLKDNGVKIREYRDFDQLEEDMKAL